MKRILSYSFVLLILLNIVGYNGLIFGLQYHNSLSMQAKMDSGKYHEEKITTLRFPLSMPYAYERLEFDQANGAFEHEGELYRLVEKKLINDTLTVVCVQDVQYRRIHDVFENYIRAFQEHSDDHPPTLPTITLIKDYLQVMFNIHHDSLGWSTTLVSHKQFVMPTEGFTSLVSLPPERRYS